MSATVVRKKQFHRATLRIVIIVIILIIGAGLRFADLGEESLWNDELESWRQSNYGTLSSVVIDGVIPDTHPPAFQIILFLTERYIGETESLLRLPSALFGSLAILVIYFIGKSFFGDPEGILAASFMAVMWAPIYYSQEARNYAMLLLFSSATSYFWLLLAGHIREGKPTGRWIPTGYVLSSVITCYTHYFGLLLVALQGFYLFGSAIFHRRNRFLVFGLGVSMVVLYSPWIPSMLEQFGRTERIGWIKPPTITAFPAYVAFAFNRLNWLGIVIFIFLGWLIVHHFIPSKNLWKTLKKLAVSSEGMILYWFLAPMVVSFIFSIVSTPIWTQRNLLIILPALYLLAAIAIFDLPIPKLWQSFVGLGICLVAVVNLVFGQGYYRIDQKEQVREAVEYIVSRNSEANDPFIIGYARYSDYFRYYLEFYSSNLEIDLIAGENDDVPTLQRVLKVEQPDRIWFISIHRKPDTGFLGALTEQYSVIDERAFQMAEVLLLSRSDD